MLDIHVVSHTHWDREWYLTYEQFRLRLVGLIDRLLDLLDAHPEYKHFHLDGQTIVLEDYLEIRPEQEARLRSAISAGRILVGPWYVMPDEFLVSGESLVRNLVRGDRIAREFGTPMPVGYLPDLFGHVAQMPQIWRQLGIDNTILWRGFGGTQAEYWWQAPDGSRVLMMHLPPEGYCNATRVLLDPAAAMDRASKAIDFERQRTVVGQALLMNGVDHVEPQTGIPDLVERLSAIPDQRARHSTLPDYVLAVTRAVGAQRPDLDTVTGELRGGEEYANLLPGVLSARVYLKQANAHVQTLLESYAEPLSVFASFLGARYPAGELRHAWKTLIQNHPHDSICGCSIDAVHEENMTRFARARQVAQAITESALNTIADTVPAATDGALRVVVVNPDAEPRTGVVQASIDVPIASAEPWRTVDVNALDRPVVFSPADVRVGSVTAVGGETVPFQMIGVEDVVAHEVSRFETPWALHVRRIHLLWWAASLPSCGYSSFDVGLTTSNVGHTLEGVPLQGMPVLQGVPVMCTEQAAENELLRVAIDDGGAIEIAHKVTGTIYRGVGLLEDAGDVGDEYNYCPPAADRRITSADGAAASVTRVLSGPLRATFRIERDLMLPSAASANRRSRTSELVSVPTTIDVTLDAGSPRVTFHVSVDNRARDHRLRIVFPAGADRVETARADTAFDVVTRPARREVPPTIKNEAPVSSAPMISVVDAGDERAGATVIGKGLIEYEIIDHPDTRLPAVALTLIRAVGDLSRNDLATRPSGHAGPPVATPAAQCPGRHQFDIAFAPHGPSPSAGRMLAAARSFTIAPATTAARKRGEAPASRRAFVRIDRQTGDAVLSALKRAEDRDTVIVRLFNPGDDDADTRVSLERGIASAWDVNLLESREDPLPLGADGVSIVLQPHQIRTIELVPVGST